VQILSGKKMLPGYLSEKGMLNGRKGGWGREVLSVEKMRGGNWKLAGAGYKLASAGS
jgi:hypothetical protein